MSPAAPGSDLGAGVKRLRLLLCSQIAQPPLDVLTFGADPVNKRSLMVFQPAEHAGIITVDTD